MSKLRAADLRIMNAEGAAFSAMQGLGERFIPAFALALGMGDVIAGLVGAIPQVTGAAMQLVGPHLVRRIGSYRNSVALFATIQAASFLPLVWAAFVGRMPVWALFVVVSFYWAGGMGAGPPWNTWMGTLIPPELRPRFFATRSRICQTCLIIGVLVAGYIISLAKARDATLIGFAIVFALAMTARAASARFLTLQIEPVPIIAGQRHYSPAGMWSRLRTGAEGRLLLLMVTMQVTVQTAGPYFDPYMLNSLKLSYTSFTFITVAMYAAKIAAFPFLGRIAHRFGTQRLLLIGGLGIIPLPALWLPSGNVAWLMFVQLFSGAAWAAWELASGILFLEGLPADERNSMLTYYNMANAIAMVGGAFIGKWVLELGQVSQTAYLTLFAVSFGVRLLNLPILLRVARK